MYLSVSGIFVSATSILLRICSRRWIMCANHMEPVKGFLSRYLRRRLIEVECKKGSRNPELWRIIDWIPKVQHHLNQFLETHVSSDVTIGKSVSEKLL